MRFHSLVKPMRGQNISSEEKCVHRNDEIRVPPEEECPQLILLGDSAGKSLEKVSAGVQEHVIGVHDICP